MKNLVILFVAWIGLSSFVSYPSSSNRLAPLHSSPVMEIKITETSSNQLLVSIQVEKLFLKGKKLLIDNSKISTPLLKKYFKEHLKIYTNNQLLQLKLKSIAQNRNLVSIQFKIKPQPSYQSLKVFSDCLVDMEQHDRMPIQINIKNTQKTYRINSENQSIQINQL